MSQEVKKGKSGKKSNSMNAAVIVLSVVFALVLVIVLCGYLIVKSKLDKINYESPGIYITGVDSETTVNNTNEGNQENSVSVDPNQDSNLEEAESQGLDFFHRNDIVYSDNVRNILIIGTDTRHPKFENSLTGNSDVMIIVSINTKTKKVVLTSIMRDTYAYIDYPESIENSTNNKDGSDLINAANARGGPELLLDTIEGNFKVPIDEYVLMNFYSVADIIDILGGVTVTITDEQAEIMNYYIRDIDKVRYEHELETYWVSPNELPGGGTYTLNGVQTVGYCRDRYSGGNDYKRTDKQRQVIEQLMGKAKTMSLSQINDLVDTILPLVYTNMSQTDIMGLAANALTYLTYEIDSQRVPFDGLFTSQTATTKYGNQGVLIPDYEATAKKLKETIDPE